MSAIEDRERSILVDVSSAHNSADAVRQLELHLSQVLSHADPGIAIDINAGDLLLTPGVLSKVKALIRSRGTRIRTLYSSVPQTQQTALDEGLTVKRFPPKRQTLPPGLYSGQERQQPDRDWQDIDLPFARGDRKAPLPKELQEVYDVLEPLASAPPSEVPVSEPESVYLEDPQAFHTSRLSITQDDGVRQPVLDASRLSALPTVYYKHNLRSGQVLESEGHVVIVGDAHSGSEIYAEGDILVWGFLGGIAHAGRNGVRTAEIRAMRIEAVQLRIADLIARRPDRLFKADTDYRGPEVARVNNGEIQIFEEIVER